MRDPDVVFAGYKIPHPLEYVMLVSVQTTTNSNPIKAFHTALVSLQREFETLKRSFVVCGLSHSHIHLPLKITPHCLKQNQLEDKGMHDD